MNKNLEGFFSWNGYFYGFKQLNNKCKYYKSKNVRFDNTCGGTKECSEKEYTYYANRYKEIVK